MATTHQDAKHIISVPLTLYCETVSVTPKGISNFAGVVASDIFCSIIHYKCVLVSRAPSVSHCLIKLVLHSINRPFLIQVTSVAGEFVEVQVRVNFVVDFTCWKLLTVGATVCVRIRGALILLSWCMVITSQNNKNTLATSASRQS